MNWRRNLYIEAIVKEYGRYGVGTEDIRKRVNTLALKGTPAEKRIQPKSGTPETKKKESAADKAQKLMLTWLVTYPGIFDTGGKISFPRPILWYRCIKRWPRCCLNSIRRERSIRQGFSTAFTDSEEQREVASLFNATIHLENEGEQRAGLFPIRCCGSRKKALQKKTVPGIRQTWPGFRN